MLGINKIKVSDQLDDRGNNTYVVEVDYYIESGKNRLGLPALDLSKTTNLYSSLINTSSGKLIVMQDLVFPTFLESALNPTIKKSSTGFRYPFSTVFTLDASESLNFGIELVLYAESSKGLRAKSTPIVVNLFNAGELLIENGDNIPVEDQRTGFYDKLFDIKVFSKGSPSGNSTVSDLFVSYGKDKSVRGTFIFDTQKFLINNSDFGYLLSNSRIPTENKRDIIGRSNIVHMEITRRKISNIRDFKNRPYSSYKNQTPKSIAALVEISDLDLRGMNYEKVIAFKDMDLVDLGKHQYSLHMRIQDGVLGWMVKTTDDLIELNSDLELKSSKMRFLAFTLLTLNQDLNISQAKLISYLKNMLKHEGSVNILKFYITNLVSTLSDIIGKSGVTSQVNSSYSQVYSKNNLNLFFMTLNKQFDAIVDFASAIETTYDYMGFVENSETGPTSISKGVMEDRANREFYKLIRDEPNSFAELASSIYKDVFTFARVIDDDLASAYFNFEPNYYAFLAPIRVGETRLSPSNTYNFSLMTSEHFKKAYDNKLTSDLSVSYYLQENGVSVNRKIFEEDPPLLDAKKNQTYAPFNQVFSELDGAVTAPAGTNTTYRSALEIEPLTNASQTFANMFLKDKERWTLSREDFDLTSTQNLLSSIDIAQYSQHSP